MPNSHRYHPNSDAVSCTNKILLNLSVILANSKFVCFCFIACPGNTYKDFLGYADQCTACPDNSGHGITGSSSLSDCDCFTGWSGSPENEQECTSKLSHDESEAAKVRLKKRVSMGEGRGVGALTVKNKWF